MSKQDAIEVKGTVIEPLLNAIFYCGIGQWTSSPCPCIRKNPDEFHPHPAGG